MARQSLPSAHDLIPFDLALKLIFRRVYVEKLTTAVPGKAHLDGLAHLVSAMVPVYTYTPDGVCVRQAGVDELKGGLFEDGGKSIYFLDGRPALEPLAVTSEAITITIAALSKFLPDENNIDGAT